MMNTLKRIFSYTKSYRAYLWGAVLGSVIGTVLSLLVPVLTGKAVDVIIGKGDVDFATLKKYAIIIIVSVLASAVFQRILGVCSNKLAYRTVRDIRNQLFDKLNGVPISFIDSNSRGDLISRAVNDIDIMSDGLIQIFMQFFTGIVTILGTLGFMIYINFKIAAIVVVLTPVSLFVAARIAKMSSNAFREQSKLRGELSGLSEEMIGSQKLVKAFAYEKRAEVKFDDINQKFYDAGTKATFFSSLTNPTTRFVNGLIYAATGLVGAIGAINGSLSIGQLASFLSYANQYTKPFNEISGVAAELQNAISSADRVFKIIDEPFETSDEALTYAENCDGTVEIEHVYFSYNKKVKLIEDMNIKVNAGQKVAIVGPTGCGKSTVINLLLRFYDVDSGTIKVSGNKIDEIKRESLRSMFGMVLQETWLFSGTIAENIAYGKSDATKEEIESAAKAAYSHSFIKRLPNGYNTFITEDGGALSQGQKQLLCIARIMLTNPPMLILDEATSNIDIRSEQKIQKAFDKIMENKTSFIIAHRLSTIKNADIILVMKDGNIIEQGSHTELLNKHGFYYDLYRSQFA